MLQLGKVNEDIVEVASKAYYSIPQPYIEGVINTERETEKATAKLKQALVDYDRTRRWKIEPFTTVRLIP